MQISPVRNKNEECFNKNWFVLIPIDISNDKCIQHKKKCWIGTTSNKPFNLCTSF